jgi:GTP-binding protein
MIGEDRVLAFDLPGTTRDSIDVPFERDGRCYVLVDTAGIRRRSRVEEIIEKFSVIKALQAIDSAQVVVGVLDAAEGVTEQDASLLGLAVQRGRAMVLAVNKWDGLDEVQRDTVRRQIDLRLPFVDFAPMHFISALHGTGVGHLLSAVDAARAAAFRDMPTARLTEILEEAVVAHAPPMVRGRRVKLRYAHQGGRNPPTVVIHGTQAERLPGTYKRYLVNTFRKAFGLEGTPVRIELRSPDNPYAGRRSKLTPRQERQKRRLGKRFKRKR